MILKEKFKKERDELGHLFYESIPFLKEFYSIETVTGNAHLFLKSRTYNKGVVVIKEGDTSKDFYLIKEGILTLSKANDYQKRLTLELKPPFKLDNNPVLLNLGRGDLFGEDSFFHSRPSTYTLTVKSASAIILSISREDFLTGYPKLLRSPSLKNFFKSR